LKKYFDLEIPSHRKILNFIRVNGEISGADLARLSSLQPSTIVYILRALEEKGLIEISRIGNSSGSAGKPPTLWRLVGKKGYIIGLEVIPSELRVTVIDFSSNVILQEQLTGINNIGEDSFISAVVPFIRNLLVKLNIDKDKVIGMGIAIPGLVDRKNGRIHYSRTLNLRNYPLQAKLNEEFGIPVEIVNDANAGVLGIRWHKDLFDKLPPDLVFLTLNVKIGQMGAGLILNNRLYEGSHGTAGEIFLSLPSLADIIKESQDDNDQAKVADIVNNREKLSISDIINYAKDNCPLCTRVLMRYAQFLINEIFRIVEFINPDLIVIGGDITEAKTLVKKYIEDSVADKLKRIYPLGVAAPKIEFSTVGIYSVSMGASALIMRKIFR